ncbi:MAG TPA: hypothetical protein VFK84_04630 [Burkholderiales bacterium]|nr:hypothetical protein [Burkholderiales bacterium]
MRKRQLGGAFGTLIIIVLLAVGGYYAYTEFMAPEAPPSCKAQLNSCVAKCRKSASEAPAMQACQDACQREAAACK